MMAKRKSYWVFYVLCAMCADGNCTMTTIFNEIEYNWTMVMVMVLILTFVLCKRLIFVRRMFAQQHSTLGAKQFHATNCNAENKRFSRIKNNGIVKCFNSKMPLMLLLWMNEIYIFRHFVPMNTGYDRWTK